MSNVDVFSGAELWLSVSELAVRRGKTKGPMSRRVARLEEQGLLKARPGPNGSKLINVAEFDRLTCETTDIVRATNGRRGASVSEDRGGDSATGRLVYSHEQALNANYSAQLKLLELEERKKNLVRMDDVISASESIAESAVREIDGLSSHAEEIAEAVGAGGVIGARKVLQRIAHDLRQSLADGLAALGENVGASAGKASAGN
jgi:DNA-binding IscR family transcriptional regulator